MPKCIFVGDNLNKVKNTMAWGPQQRVDVFHTAAVVQEFFADREEFSDTASEVKLENLKSKYFKNNFQYYPISIPCSPIYS